MASKRAFLVRLTVQRDGAAHDRSVADTSFSKLLLTHLCPACSRGLKTSETRSRIRRILCRRVGIASLGLLRSTVTITAPVANCLACSITLLAKAVTTSSEPEISHICATSCLSRFAAIKVQINNERRTHARVELLRVDAIHMLFTCRLSCPVAVVRAIAGSCLEIIIENETIENGRLAGLSLSKDESEGPVLQSVTRNFPHCKAS